MVTACAIWERDSGFFVFLGQTNRSAPTTNMEIEGSS